MSEKANRRAGNSAGETLENAGGAFNDHITTHTPTPQFSASTVTPTPIYAAGKIVGNVSGIVFYKTITGSKHLLRKPPAIAFSVASLEAAELAGAQRVEVTDRETNVTYRAFIAHVWQRGREMKRGGFERQIYLPLHLWMTQNDGPVAVIQLSFLGEAV